MNAEEKLRKLNICGVPKIMQHDLINATKLEAIQKERKRIIEAILSNIKHDITGKEIKQSLYNKAHYEIIELINKE